jgi:NAD(P)-dependent dehydrogenase (short-subunit alcohol dehydrogenase family)
MGRLDGRVAVIAGGGSGIGAATARRLAAEGARVVIGDLAATAAEAVAAEIAAAGGSAVGVGFDITDEASVAALVGTALERFGGLDICHVNAADLAAILQDTDALTVPLEVFDRTLAVNLRGHLLVTRHALPALLARGGGAIIYTSSAAGFVGEPERVSYAVSKSGLHALVRHVATRWGKEGVRANAVAPGLVLTAPVAANMPEKIKAGALARTRSTRLGTPEDIAGTVAMLASDDGAWINGQILSVDGGTTMR